MTRVQLHTIETATPASRPVLQRVIDAIVDVAGVVRASTVIELARPLPYRVLPLVRAAAAGQAGSGPAAAG